MKKNENGTDRLVRALLAAIFFILGFFWLGGILGIVAFVLAAVMLVTAITGFCGLYTILKIDTSKMKLNKKLNSGLIVLLVITLLGGTYASIFFSKKIFLEDFNVINNEYKQLLFNSGKEKRAESIQNYESFVPKLTDFADKYTAYKPYAIKFDIQFDQDLSGIQNAMLIINPMIYSGDLVKAHEILEGVRAIFQEILKRDGFSLLTVALVDFHDVMEELITASDEKNTETLIATYNLANEKLTDIETNYLNDDSIKQIRSDLLALLDLAQQNKADDLAAQAQKLKASFIKVYLKN